MSTETSIEKPTALCLMGPTASGKTDVAVKLCEQYPFAVISVDSALVYRGMDIGSGKPDKATLAHCPHRLVDIRDPADPYSAAEFRHDAVNAMQEIHAAGRIPLLVGGTMLYFKVLRDGLANMPSADPKIRQQILDLASREGWQAVHDRLAAVDAESAARIHPNDPQRLQRALEVYLATGKSMTQHLESQHAPNDVSTSLPFRLCFTAMYPQDRAILHKRIELRFMRMLELGLVDEVQALMARGDLHHDLPSIRSVGYRQVWDYLAGAYDYQTMIARALAATRQLAKRQLTWLRSWPELHVFDSESDFLAAEILKYLKLVEAGTT